MLNKFETKDGKYVCDRCGGNGRIVGPATLCPKCEGSGKLDWIENIVGKISPNIWYASPLKGITWTVTIPEDPNVGSACYVDGELKIFDGKTWVKAGEVNFEFERQ